MKKILFMTLFLVLSLSISNSNFVMAKENVILFSETIITEKDKLFELAVENDVSSKQTIVIADSQKSSTVDEEKLVITEYKYTQKYLVREDNNSTTTSYVTTTFHTINTKQKKYEDSTIENPTFEPLYDSTLSTIVIGIGGGGGNTYPTYDESHYISGWDGSIGVKAYSTVYWDNITIGDNSYIDIVYVDGGWTVYDMQLSIEPVYVYIAQKDLQYSQSLTYNNVQTVYEYGTPPSWNPISSYSDHVFGLKTHCKIIRGGSTWYLTLNNVNGNLSITV